MQTQTMTSKNKNGEPIFVLPIVRLNKDAVAAIRAGEHARAAGKPISAGIAGVSNPSEVRVLVDLYYRTQEMRKRVANQILALDRGVDTGEEHTAADLMLAQAEVWEHNMSLFLAAFAQTHRLWPWFEAVHGIGPVLAAGLVAHLGSRPVPPTVGHWWRYAGLDPSQQWLSAEEIKKRWETLEGDVDMRTRAMSKIIGRDPKTVIRDATIDFKSGEEKKLTKSGAIKSLARIPFNRPLKTLCWKIGDQFVKLGNKENAFYAQLYREKKAEQIAWNESGKRRKMAEETLKKYPNHAQKKIYQQGKIPDGRVDLIARRKTVKMFLSHLHEIWWRLDHEWKDPPKPFSVSIKGHAHYIPPPHGHVFDSIRQESNKKRAPIS